ncbi:hypothetical protein [Streptomyces boncukensis]|uniref:Uncharacterized protein n=1 Tax=Streptomyces boncukensis TaxID=2711219 RepID=A0A6G4WZH7_9ACTN|nr:hypothetical protein [Streptomyces boncukensis]NGO70528.1 hypothetical protein [Streptomyces boncukensis]
MTEGHRPRTPQDRARRRAIADAASGGSGWAPRRGDLVIDTRDGSVGVVIALPEDTATFVYHLRPEGGGKEWGAPFAALRPHPEATDDLGLNAAESVMPHDDAWGRDRGDPR